MNTKEEWLHGPMSESVMLELQALNKARQALALAQLKKSGKSLLCCRQARIRPMPMMLPPSITYWRAS